MFATLIDNKIMSVWDDLLENDIINLKLFDCRIKILRYLVFFFIYLNSKNCYKCLFN